MYSLDLREKLLELKKNGWSITTIANEFSMSRATIYRWLDRAAEGKLAAQGGGPRFRKLDKEAVFAHIRRYPDQTLQEMAEIFKVHLTSLHYFFKRHRITYKKKHAIHRTR
jgi:transposase